MAFLYILFTIGLVRHLRLLVIIADDGSFHVIFLLLWRNIVANAIIGNQFFIDRLLAASCRQIGGAGDAEQVERTVGFVS